MMPIEENNQFGWYALRVAVGKETGASKSLRMEIDRNHELVNYFGEIFVPSEDVVDVSSGKKRNINRKLFPGYIFVNMIKNDQTYQLIRRINGISFVRGLASRPMLKADIDSLMSRMQGDEGPRLKVQFRVGDSVRVKDGPFADFNGQIEKIIADKHRLVVSVFIFGRSTPIELEYRQVEKIT